MHSNNSNISNKSIKKRRCFTHKKMFITLTQFHVGLVHLGQWPRWWLSPCCQLPPVPGPMTTENSNEQTPKVELSTLFWDSESAAVLTPHCCFGCWTQLDAAGTTNFGHSDPLHPALLSSSQLSLAGLSFPQLGWTGARPHSFISQCCPSAPRGICVLMCPVGVSWRKKEGIDSNGSSGLMATASPLGRGRQKWCTSWK